MPMGTWWCVVSRSTYLAFFCCSACTATNPGFKSKAYSNADSIIIQTQSWCWDWQSIEPCSRLTHLCSQETSPEHIIRSWLKQLVITVRMIPLPFSGQQRQHHYGDPRWLRRGRCMVSWPCHLKASPPLIEKFCRKGPPSLQSSQSPQTRHASLANCILCQLSYICSIQAPGYHPCPWHPEGSSINRGKSILWPPQYGWTQHEVHHGTWVKQVTHLSGHFGQAPPRWTSISGFAGMCQTRTIRRDTLPICEE